MRINIDIDCTINDFIEKFLEYLNGTGHNFTLKQITDYDLAISTGIRADVLKLLFFKNNAFYDSLLPLPDAVDTIKSFIDNDHDVRFVTAITYDVIDSRIRFMKEFFPFVNVDKQLIVTNDKHGIYADIVIDDYDKNLTNINDHCFYILFEQPWNADLWLRTKFKSAANWREIKKIVDGL